jgi:hypothetical protein
VSTVAIAASAAPAATCRCYTARIVAGVHALDRAGWEALFPEEVESYAYYEACESAGHTGYTLSAVAVFSGGRMVAAAPLFQIDFRLDSSLQGRLRPLGAWLVRHLPGLMVLRVLGLGSPLAERCHIGLAPDLDPIAREQVLATLLAAVDEQARQVGARLVALKDLAQADADRLDACLRHHGFARTSSLPVATLDLPSGGLEDYLARLSRATRKDIRRKLKGAAGIRVERRTAIEDVAGEIDALYNETRQQSRFDYGDLETLPPQYFRAVSRALGDRAVVMLYYVGDQLAAFNLLLIEKKRVIDKFLGMRYPLAREYDLYILSWIENVKFALMSDATQLQSGQTAYAEKLRLGSRLVPSAIYFKHRNRLAHGCLGLFARLFPFDRMDPDLGSRKGGAT